MVHARVRCIYSMTPHNESHAFIANTPRRHHTEVYTHAYRLSLQLCPILITLPPQIHCYTDSEAHSDNPATIQPCCHRVAVQLFDSNRH